MQDAGGTIDVSETEREKVAGAAELPTGLKRNFVILIWYNVLVRVGWIFKTESIIMPAIVDAISGGVDAATGSGALRGCLPMLNRLGQSIPPILVSDRIRKARFKKWVLFGCAALMSASFFSLAFVWTILDGRHPSWLPYLFLSIYGLFWLCVGVHNLCVSLLYGKLVEVTSRGRLMLIAMTAGAIAAISCAWFLMRNWLAVGEACFVWLFVATGVPFFVAALLATLLKEQPDLPTDKTKTMAQTLRVSWQIMKVDSNFRLLTLVAGCYAISITLIPHYQAYAKSSLNLGLESFVPWVIAQNVGAAILSIPLGRIADKFGNRLAVQCTMILLCAAPLLTMVWSHYPTANPEVGFYLIFFLLGLTPLTMRTFSNYTLEIADRNQQPVYLSTLGVCMALPVVLFSTPVGAVIDAVGFEIVFVVIVVILFFGWILTFRLNEPRTITPINPPGTAKNSVLD